MGFLIGVSIGVVIGWCAAAMVLGGRNAPECLDLERELRAGVRLLEKKAGGALPRVGENRGWAGQKRAI
jgi:hypothetical protein